MSQNANMSAINEHKGQWYLQNYGKTFSTYTDLHFPNWCSGFPTIVTCISTNTFIITIIYDKQQTLFPWVQLFCVYISLEINCINTCETPQRQDSSITNTAFKCIWTGIELERTEMFWKREFPNISNQHCWTLDCNCLNTVDSVSTIQVRSHKETFVSDGWIAEWKPFPLLSCQYDCLVRNGPSECSRCNVNTYTLI